MKPSLLDTILQESPLRAVIREEECIGCLKCITACPVDAILGASKHMHTVIQDQCIGCTQCVEPCPVDCIDMVPSAPLTPSQLTAAHHHMTTHTNRLEKEAHAQKAHYQKIKNGFHVSTNTDDALMARKNFIKVILSRGKPGASS